MSQTTETAIFAGGCFWGMQGIIRHITGVLRTRVGYTGGRCSDPRYRNHGNHAEAIEVVFDPNVLSYRALLEFFFQIHDPSTRNRQGNDVGTSYRWPLLSERRAETGCRKTIADVEASRLWPGKSSLKFLKPVSSGKLIGASGLSAAIPARVYLSLCASGLEDGELAAITDNVLQANCPAS